MTEAATSTEARLHQAARDMLPDHVCCAVVPVGHGQLLPAEQAAMLRAVPYRRAEFAAGRLALRQAIAATGFQLASDRPILSRPDRRPDLPEGISASLAHAGGICIAIATRQSGRALGIDIEPFDAARPETLAEAVRPFRFRDMPEDALLAFCAKEALFKRQFPSSGRLLDFGDISLVISGNGGFVGCISGQGLMRGRWRHVAGYHLAVTEGQVRD